MAEIILPPEEEQEETPQVPELNIDKPTENSKVITIEFEAKKTNKASTKDTNQQLYTTDTDAWFEFKETSLEGANGTYSVVFRNRHDGSIFQRTGDVVGGVAYYKIPHQEIRHAGAWRGQLVYTLENGNTTAREFDYDVKGHMLDGKDVREIVVEDFETLMSQLRSMKDSAEVELASLTQELRNATDTAEQNETDRQAFFDELVEDINEFEENERQRQENEQGRESAESVRVANEEERELNEAERISKDSERDSKIEAVNVSATNEIVNGSFAKGREGWSSYRGSATTSGDSIRITGDSSGRVCQLWQPSDFPAGRKYYLSAHIKVVENISLISLRSYPAPDRLWQLNAPPHSEWLRASGIYDAKRTLERTLYFTFDGEGIGVAELKHPLIIDLTTTFGAGNEPTAEQMDRLLEQFPNSWFDGTVNIYNNKHMMGMLFKELTKLNNAIITSGGNV